VSKWEKVKLGDVVTLLNGRAYKQNELLKEGKTPVLRVGNFFSNKDWYYSDLELEESKYCDEGDLLYAWSASFGPKIWGGPKVIYHYHIWKLVLTDRISKNYLYYLLEYSTKSIKDQGRGITMLHATKGGMEKMMIPLPPLEVQKQIAKNLDTVSELLALRKKQLEELDGLIKSVFYDMFGDPALNDKGWEVKKIKDLATSISYGTSQKATTEKLGFPVLRMNNITYTGDIDLSDLKYIELNAKDEEKYLVYKGELLFNRTNSKELVGKTAVFKEDTPMAYAGYLVKLTSNHLSNTDFISGYLNSLYGKSTLLNMAKNIVGMANINAKELGNMSIYVPPIELQNQFSMFIDKVNEQKLLVKQSIEETQQLFDSLMSQYFD